MSWIGGGSWNLYNFLFEFSCIDDYIIFCGLLLQLLSYLMLNSTFFMAQVVLIWICLLETFFRAVNIAQDRFLPKRVWVVKHRICDILHGVVVTRHPDIWWNFIEATILNCGFANCIRLFIDAHVRILDSHVTDLDFFGLCCLLFNKRVLILLLNWLIILLLLVVNRYL